MNRRIRKLLSAALALALALSLAACGREAPEDGVEEGTLALASWSLSAAVWSSSDGATVQVTAVPAAHGKNDTALFLARLEGTEVDRAVCQWEKGGYTASLDLPAADGYCYYVVLSNGSDVMEIPINTPTDPFDVTLIDLGTSLRGNCALQLESAAIENGALTISGGSAVLEMPVLGGGRVTCLAANLRLSCDGDLLEAVPLELPAPENGGYSIPLQTVRFQTAIPEDGRQLSAALEAELSDGQVITAYGGSWLISGDGLTQSVG